MGLAIRWLQQQCCVNRYPISKGQREYRGSQGWEDESCPLVYAHSRERRIGGELRDRDRDRRLRVDR
jgi:hypothetical protein